MSTTTLVIPAPIHKELTFRWFVEYVIDNSDKFHTASALTKAVQLLGADLKPGKRKVDTAALDLLRSVLTDEAKPFTFPALQVSAKGPDGQPTGEPQSLSPRIWVPYLKALLP